jgi:hypothetical protein
MIARYEPVKNAAAKRMLRALIPSALLGIAIVSQEPNGGFHDGRSLVVAAVVFVIITGSLFSVLRRRSEARVSDQTKPVQARRLPNVDGTVGDLFCGLCDCRISDPARGCTCTRSVQMGGNTTRGFAR